MESSMNGRTETCRKGGGGSLGLRVLGEDKKERGVHPEVRCGRKLRPSSVGFEAPVVYTCHPSAAQITHVDPWLLRMNRNMPERQGEGQDPEPTTALRGWRQACLVIFLCVSLWLSTSPQPHLWLWAGAGKNSRILLLQANLGSCG